MNTVGFGTRKRMDLVIERRLCVNLVHGYPVYFVITNFPEIDNDAVCVYQSPDYADAYEKWYNPLLTISTAPPRPWKINTPDGEEFGFDTHEDAVHWCYLHDYPVRHIDREKPPRYQEDTPMGNYATDEY